MKESPSIALRVTLSLLASGLVGICLWTLGATIGEAVVDGVIFGIATIICLSILQGNGLFIKVTGALILSVACLQTIGFGITYVLDGKGDPFAGWLAATMLAAMLVSARPVFSRLGLSRRTNIPD